MSIDEIRALFDQEFGVLTEKFTVFEIPAANVSTCTEPGVWHPGVYVWWHPDKGVVKVGRHFTNSRKRALEHLRDNTGGTMAALATDPNAKLVLFNLKSPEDRHWAAALEVYFERNLSPSIASDRLG